MAFGAEVLADGGVRFRLWAPGIDRVGLELIGADGKAVVETFPMRQRDEGWHECEVARAGAGTLYRYRVGDALSVPDPASRFNPFDVDGPSQVVDPGAYRWMQTGWTGLPWHTAVIYELHLGTFTPEGRLDAAQRRLPELKAIGVNTIELMPVADFPGARNWGYDGVLAFAPDASYGTPEDLKRFIDAAHGLGLMVLLDVVYNHFGPDGNHLPSYCPDFFDTSQHTPWGAAIDFDALRGPWVRRFFLDNAMYWIEEYRFDGLRLDATHAIPDGSDPHIVTEIARALHDGPGRARHVHLVVENDRNAAAWLARDRDRRPLVADAQWNDDLHHAAHVLATGQVDSYYSDYAEAPLAQLGRALAEGFVYQGQPSAFKKGEARGEPSTELPSQAFVSFLQNHDQIGNRAFGERLDALASRERVDALLACVLLSPHTPMLFMGEEYAAQSPFLFFCDFSGELAQAVANGRRNEFSGFAEFRDPAARERIRDPNDAATFAASKLRWTERDLPAGRQRLALVTALIALRRQHLVPLLPLQRGGGTAQVEGNKMKVSWQLGDRCWLMRANLAPKNADARTAQMPIGDDEHEVYRSPAVGRLSGRLHLPPDGVYVSLASKNDQDD